MLSVGGVCGWVFMSLIGREGECSENTQPTHTPTAATIMGRETSVVKQHTPHTHTPTVHTLTGWISTWFGVGWLD